MKPRRTRNSPDSLTQGVCASPQPRARNGNSMSPSLPSMLWDLTLPPLIPEWPHLAILGGSTHLSESVRQTVT